uniref:Uncharacterized protein n=1 Tax=Magallana gigas TaxID=29159 RepID=K1RM72_MAGGI
MGYLSLFQTKLSFTQIIPLDADYTQLLEEIKERYAGKLTRPTRPHHRTVSPSREMSSFAPAPTPASNIRGITRQLHQPLFRREIPRPLEGDETGLMGSSTLNYNTAVQRQTWNMSTSLVRGDPSDPMNSMNTPRILELDINRMLIGQNTIRPDGRPANQRLTEQPQVLCHRQPTHQHK